MKESRVCNSIQNLHATKFPRRQMRPHSSKISSQISAEKSHWRLAMTFPEAMFYSLLLKASIVAVFIRHYMRVSNPRTLSTTSDWLWNTSHFYISISTGITTALARSRRTLCLKWERKSRTNSLQVWHNSHTRQQRTTQYITCCSGA